MAETHPTVGQTVCDADGTKLGAVGDIDEMPEGCLYCGAPRDDFYYWTED
jgi:hypothetical protein